MFDFTCAFVVIGVFVFGLIAGIKIQKTIQRERHEMEEATTRDPTSES